MDPNVQGAAIIMRRIGDRHPEGPIYSIFEVL